MTLFRQIMLVVVPIFVLLFSGNFALTVLESRAYLKTQMQAHAQDTATSLGLSMTTALSEADNANLELLTSAVFDRGYYSDITLTDINNNVLIKRGNSLQVDGTPRWFVDLLKLPNPQGRAEITQGWQQLGVLTVRAHPGNAYRDLWRITVNFSYLFIAIVILSYGLLRFVIGFVMEPLRAVEAQADEICERQFAIVDTVPKTRELRRVVNAMNRMSKKLKKLFESQVELTEKLRIEAREDALTGLNNRKEFDSIVDTFLSTEHESGSSVLMLLQIRDFARINDKLGYAAADQLLVMVAERLSEALHSRDTAILCRRSGAEFAVFIPQLNFELARISLERAFQQVASLQQFTEPDFANVVHMSAVFTPEPTAKSELLSAVDAALRTAQASGKNSTYFLIYGNQDNPVSDLVKQASEWRETLVGVIERQDFLFHYQPIYSIADDNQLGFAEEIFVRIELDSKVISAGVFMPMAERFGLLIELDELIIDRALRTLPSDSCKIVLNLSTYSLQDSAFHNWLLVKMRDYHQLARKVVFELQEHAIHLAYDPIKTLISTGNELGYEFSVDHFGISNASFAYLQSIDLKYIKIDRSFVSEIESDMDNQFFVQSVTQIAEARDMLVIAEGVERAEELETLKSLNVYAAMGYFLGRPGPEISLT